MQEAGNLSTSKRRIGSRTNSSFQKKNGCRIAHIRRWKPKSRSHVKTIGSVLSKRKASELSSNGARNKCLNGKALRRRTSLKVNDTSSSEKPLSSMFQSIKSLTTKSQWHEKATARDIGNQRTRRRRKNKKKKNGELDEAARLQRRARYLLIKMKREQNLIEAYSGEGWKGQSREKIKPEKELQRAKKQILKCKLGIRDAIRQLESLSSVGCIEDSVIGPDGSVFHEHIFCSKCKLRDAFPDNDIILCDGTCNCAFHQKCLDPPLATENIPPDDQGWYCKYCECKIGILEGIDAHLGTQFSPNSKWQDIFLEAANAHDCEDTTLFPGGDWPSDESEDIDYDPESNERSCSYSRMGSEENMSDDASSSGSLYWTSEDDGSHNGGLGTDGHLDSGYYGGKTELQDFDKINDVDTVVSMDSIDSRAAYRRRQRRDVDYKKLHDEMFGKEMPESEEISEDEDWGPCRRKRRRNESNAAGTLVSMCGPETGSSDVAPRNNETKIRSVPKYRRKLFRIPPVAVKKLREVFAEDELPPRVVRETLSKQLGIALEKINKWFKNARYAALKNRKAERTKHPSSSTGITKQSCTGSGKVLSSDVVASKDNPYLVSSATRFQGSKNLRTFCRRKSSILMVSPRKPQEKSSAGAPSTNVGVWLSKAESLKRQASSLKCKAALEKQVKPTFSNPKEQLYMVELERIFNLEEKLEKMKEVLSSVANNKIHATDGCQMNGASVVYVPVAEVREKT